MQDPQEHFTVLHRLSTTAVEADMDAILEVASKRVSFFDRACKLNKDVMEELKIGIYFLKFELVQVMKEREELKSQLSLLQAKVTNLTSTVSQQKKPVSNIQKGLRDGSSISQQVNHQSTDDQNMVIIRARGTDTAENASSVMQLSNNDFAPSHHHLPASTCCDEASSAAVSNQSINATLDVSDHSFCDKQFKGQLSDRPIGRLSTPSFCEAGPTDVLPEELTGSTNNQLFAKTRTQEAILFDQLTEVEKPHKCKECGKGFTILRSLKRHFRLHTGQNVHTCTRCTKVFYNKINLEAHMKSHTGEKPYKCSHCQYAFAELSRLRRHVRVVHTSEKPFQCRICNRAFPDSSNVRCHERTHSDKKPYKCPVCNNTYRLNSTLYSHMKTHNDTRPHKCGQCGKGFREKRSLTRHMWTHTGYNCEKCGKTFDQRKLLMIHLKEHHSATRENCQDDAVDVSLDHHDVRKEKTWSCELCKSVFTSAASLNVHMRMHSGERPYRCDKCGQGFVYSSHMRRHERRAHSSERPHKCPQCEKTFSHADNLRVHVRTHSEEKPFKCRECQSNFKHHSSLVSHQKKKHQLPIVPGKPFHCSICVRSFASSLRYDRHMTYHKTVYRCDHCVRGYGSQEERDEHVKTEHNQNSSS